MAFPIDLVRRDLAKQAATMKCDGAASAAPAGAGGEVRDARAAGAGAVPPPLLTGGERVSAGAEPSEIGGLSKTPSRLVERLVMTATGEVKTVCRRHGCNSDAAFVDWLNFTVDVSAFEWDDKCVEVSEEKMIVEASVRLESIFGFGLTGQLPNGRNFYQRAWALGGSFGFLACGGQRGTVLVSVSGTGLAAAREGWELRLYTWLSGLSAGKRAKLTRVDCAHDVYDGSYSVDLAKAAYVGGGADCQGRMPVCEQRGDWHRPNGEGRTFYIGKRSSGKFARVYEKGKQLGDASSEWARIEVELKSVDRILPFEVLLHPGQYLAGSYPMFSWIAGKQKRIATVKKAVQAAYAGRVVWARRQVGGLLKFIRDMEDSAASAFDLLVRFDAPLPGWVKSVAPAIEDAGEPLHGADRPKLPLAMQIEESIAAW